MGSKSLPAACYVVLSSIFFYSTSNGYKNANDVSQAMERMFKSGHDTPKNMQADDGTEFFNSKF